MYNATVDPQSNLDPAGRDAPFHIIGLTGLRTDSSGGQHGTAGAGKDTVATYLCGLMPFHQIALADPIKRALNAMFGFPWSTWTMSELKERPLPDVGVTPRYLAQTLGTEWGRDTIHGDLWLLLAERHIRELYRDESCGGVIISDIRFDNEASWIKELGGELVRVVRPVSDDQIDNGGHTSEAGVVDELVDHTILNDSGFEYLEHQVRDYVHGLTERDATGQPG